MAKYKNTNNLRSLDVIPQVKQTWHLLLSMARYQSDHDPGRAISTPGIAGLLDQML